MLTQCNRTKCAHTSTLTERKREREPHKNQHNSKCTTLNLSAIINNNGIKAHAHALAHTFASLCDLRQPYIFLLHLAFRCHCVGCCCFVRMRFFHFLSLSFSRFDALHVCVCVWTSILNVMRCSLIWAN